MPLLDHFRPPVSDMIDWPSMHSCWAVALMTALNQTLPRRYMAQVQVRLGRQAEADVAEFDRGFPPDCNGDHGAHNGHGAVAVEVYAPPTTTAVLPGTFPDDIEVTINDRGAGGSRLVAVIELASPGNKDRSENRRAFAVKTAAYLQRGIGVVVADLVTDKLFNLHDELIDLLGQSSMLHTTPSTHTYAVSYRAARRNEENQIDVWTFPLAVGQPLPVVPLALRATTTIPLDLESTYTEARRNSRLD